MNGLPFTVRVKQSVDVLISFLRVEDPNSNPNYCTLVYRANIANLGPMLSSENKTEIKNQILALAKAQIAKQRKDAGLSNHIEGLFFSSIVFSHFPDNDSTVITFSVVFYPTE